jgi:hypothetical protein
MFKTHISLTPRLRAAIFFGLTFVVNQASMAASKEGWAIEYSYVPNDPYCRTLQKVIAEYFRHHPTMPMACIDTALSGAFEMPPLQPIKDASLAYRAQIEKYLQVGPAPFFKDQDEQRPIEEMYFYRAELGLKYGVQLLAWHGEMGEKLSPYVSIPGDDKTILVFRAPMSYGGCEGDRDNEAFESLIFMKADMSAPLRIETSGIQGLFDSSRLRLSHGVPVLIGNNAVYKQEASGFERMCSFKKIRRK